jgi:cytochrome c2
LIGLLLLCCDLAAAADPKEGARVFRKCQPCHSLDPGETRIGPSLAGVFGRKSGVLPGFEYSGAMKSANITWNAESLEKFLSDTQGFVPGNRMPFTGLHQKQERDDVIAYLRQVASESGKPEPAADADAKQLPDPRVDLENVHAPRGKAVKLQVMLWSQPYGEDGDVR